MKTLIIHPKDSSLHLALCIYNEWSIIMNTSKDDLNIKWEHLPKEAREFTSFLNYEDYVPAETPFFNIPVMS